MATNFRPKCAKKILYSASWCFEMDWKIAVPVGMMEGYILWKFGKLQFSNPGDRVAHIVKKN